MPDPVNAELLKFQIESLQKDLVEERQFSTAVLVRVVALESERTSGLKYGITLLGTVVIGLVAWIANYVLGAVK